MAEEKFRGVHRRMDGCWTATIGENGKHRYLGYFRNFEVAKAARLEAEISVYGRPLERLSPVFYGDVVKIPLHGRGLVFHGWTTVSIRDWPRVSGVAWTLSKTGYAVGRPSDTSGVVKLHRWILRISDELHVDHINRDTLDNRRENLRVCTQTENARNSRLAKNNSSGFKGVSRTVDGKRWRARITVDRHEIRLGHFDTAEEASKAYDDAARKYHGDFASPNAAPAQCDRKGTI